MKVIALLATLLTVNLASASTETETRGVFVPGKLSSQFEPEGTWGFMGLNLGVVDSETRLKHEKDVAGSQFDLRILGSYYLADTPWVFDGGVGMQNSHLGKGQSDRNVAAVYLEASPRYRFTSNWQVGPVGKMFVMGDSDFYEDSESPAGFLGAALDYEFPWLEDNIVRLGARVLTDVNVDSRRVTMAMVDLQIGMPFTGKPQVRMADRTPKPAPVVETVEVIEQPLDVSEAEVVRTDVALDDVTISYQLGKVQPTLHSQTFLENLGRLLADEGDLVEGVEIQGHTDDLGKPLTNEILGHSRAQLAAKAMAAAGLSVDKLDVESFASRRPLASAKDERYKNRRIEIIFKGVKDEGRLRQLIKQAL